ncbi:MAG: SRPBCC family protein [Gemmatimonadaceae bacterium]|nr:SRPBCC family protein [Gemmatimonadaceae bacterium]NUO95068.1 SRPBCC family protein [Gemmatimonadaceae bacterium]NUS33834.1 SRPBCC family protein [Gemmatimonadaceae bacterium]NUS48313.1 SRPBCC family protein [Gemmatimonadaceae bacterium]
MMETATQQGDGVGSAGGERYLTGTDKPIRAQGEGGRVTGDGVEREVDLPRARRADKLAQGLGWFSIGLGTAQILAPRAMSRLVGVKNADHNTGLMRALGVREIAAGIGLLADPKPTGFAVARVAGDAMDLALLVRTLATPENDKGRALFATAAVVGVGLLDVLASEELSTTAPKVTHPDRSGEALSVKRSVTVSRPVEEVYAFWKDFENLPRFMKHLDRVENTGESTSRWSAGAAQGESVQWEVQLVESQPNRLLSWKTIGISDITAHGRVEFAPAPGGRGTEVRASLSYQVPGGAVGKRIAMIFRDVPGVKIENELNVFKQIMETGEEVRSDASIHKGPHPAQPPSDRVNFQDQTTA